MVEVFANSGDPEQMPHSDLGLHCLPIALVRASRLQRIKYVSLAGLNS